MPILIDCPYCEKRLKVRVTESSRHLVCTACRNRILLDATVQVQLWFAKMLHGDIEGPFSSADLQNWLAQRGTTEDVLGIGHAYAGPWRPVDSVPDVSAGQAPVAPNKRLTAPVLKMPVETLSADEIPYAPETDDLEAANPADEHAPPVVVPPPVVSPIPMPSGKSVQVSAGAGAATAPVGAVPSPVVPLTFTADPFSRPQDCTAKGTYWISTAQDLPADPTIMAKLLWPTRAIAIVGALGILLRLVQFIIILFRSFGGDPGNLWAFETFVAPGGMAGMVFHGMMGLFLIFAAHRSYNLETYWMAMASGVIAAVPCLSPCCVPGLPIGIWLVTLLLQPDVRTAFRE